ncbi:DUF6207 family protein [Streptomyces chartreusis]|uniref:DUF6207 family protein n=1 Tax=Streptomyces chartreusis TaxID=1969 RepID=UPI003D947B7C
MPVPHADPALARDCSVCLGWGSVITGRGSYELCPECQSGPDGDTRAAGGPREDRQALAAADDTTALAILLAGWCALAPADQTIRDAGEPGVRLRCFLDLRQAPDP